MIVKLSLMIAGYCTHKEKMVLRGGRDETIRFPDMFALIEHPRHGPILYDTGYSSHFHAATRRFPYSLYAAATPVTLEPHETAVNQLRARGIQPEDVRHIIISHFHGDHVAGLKDFPRARFICMKHGYLKIRRMKGFSAVRRGFLPDLLPADFDERVRLIDKAQGSALPPFRQTIDYFGDGSVQLVVLDGHFSGQVGALIQSDTGQHFLISDACWLSQGYQDHVLPHPVAMLLMNDRRQYRQDLLDIRQFQQQNPDVHIIPSHCSATLERFVAL